MDLPNADPYENLEKKGHSYKLDLLENLGIHTVFHADRLRKAVINLLPGQYVDPKPFVLRYDKKVWKIEDIIAARLYDNKLQCKVK